MRPIDWASLIVLITVPLLIGAAFFVYAWLRYSILGW